MGNICVDKLMWQHGQRILCQSLIFKDNLLEVNFKLFALPFNLCHWMKRGNYHCQAQACQLYGDRECENGRRHEYYSELVVIIPLSFESIAGWNWKRSFWWT